MIYTLRYHLIGVVTTLSGLMSSPPASGQDTLHKLTLDQAVSRALEHDVRVRNALLDTRIARKQVMETRGTGLPQINAAVDYQHFVEQPVSLIPAEFLGGQPGEFAEVKFGTANDMLARIRVEQLIFDGSYFVGLKAAHVYVELSRVQERQSRREVRTGAEQAYYGALVAQARVDILRRNRQTLQKVFEETRARYENGFVERLDVDRLELTVANTKVQLRKARKEDKLARDQLAQLTGIALQDSIVLIDSLEQYLGSLEELIEKEELNYHDRLEYQTLAVQQALQLLDIRRHQSAYLPRLTGFASHQENAQREAFNFMDTDRPWFPSTIVGVSLKVPIFHGLQRSARISRARLEMEQLQNRMEDLQSRLALEVRQSSTRFKNAHVEYRQQKQNLTLAERIYRTAVSKYEEGVGSSLEVANAESNLYQTQAGYLQTVFELLTAKTDLKKALGKYR